MPMLREFHLFQQSAHREAVFICAPILDLHLKLTEIKGTTMEALGRDSNELVE